MKEGSAISIIEDLIEAEAQYLAAGSKQGRQANRSTIEAGLSPRSRPANGSRRPPGGRDHITVTRSGFRGLAADRSNRKNEAPQPKYPGGGPHWNWSA